MRRGTRAAFAALVLASLTTYASAIPRARAAARPSPAPTAGTEFAIPPLAKPIPLATPALIATPAPTSTATQNLVLPPVPALATISPGGKELPSGGIVGAAEPFVGISLTDAIGMALRRNTDLAVSQSNRRIAAYQIVTARGAYDLNLQVMPSYTVAITPPVSALQTGPNGAPEERVTAGATLGVSQLTGSGGRIQASTQAQRINDNILYDTYNPYYEASFALSYSQPLARNLAIDVYREQLQLTKINRDLTSDNALLTASNTIDSVSVAYDNLISAWKNVGIQEDSLLQAKAQSESNARLVRRGQSAPIDVVQSNEQINEFQDSVYSAIQNVATQQNQLKSLILSDPADAIWTANLVPTTPVGAAPPEPSLTDVTVAALDHRPEVAQLRDDLRSQNVRVAYSKDQTKPQVDLNFSITELGFAGAQQNVSNTPLFSVLTQEISTLNALVAAANAAAAPGTPPLATISGAGLSSPLQPGSVGKIGAAYHSALVSQYPQYQVSATIGFPLQNRVAKSELAIAREQRAQYLTQELALVQRVQLESRNALQAYRSARSRLIAASAARDAAARVSASEIRRFRAGESTTYLVLQRQVMLSNERLRELQAQTDVANALVELDRVTGAILSKNNVDVGSLGTGPQGNVPVLVTPTKR